MSGLAIFLILSFPGHFETGNKSFARESRTSPGRNEIRNGKSGAKRFVIDIVQSFLYAVLCSGSDNNNSVTI